MSDHHEGKVAVLMDRLVPVQHLERKIGGSSNKKEDKANYAHEIAIVRGKYQNDQANLRYMAACWNACEGSKVEDLEELGSDYIAPIIKLIDANEAAHTLLKEIRQRFVDFGECGELAHRINAFLEKK